MKTPFTDKRAWWASLREGTKSAKAEGGGLLETAQLKREAHSVIGSGPM